jgi:hypothetical protein
MKQIQIADLFDGSAKVRFQQIIYLRAERRIVELHETHIAKAAMFNEEKNLVVEKLVHQRLFESSDFSDRTVPFVSARSSPFWRPGLASALANHQGMVPEPHALQ